MSLTSPNAPLMREILKVIRAHGQNRTYDSNWITERIRESGFWDNRNPTTPHRTINSYFAQSLDIFERVGPNQYRLRLKHFEPRRDNPQIDDAQPSGPGRTEQTISRVIRQTALIEQLKVLHDNRCQICGLALQLGDRSYSEGHHIRPLGRNGPDIVENILILCPTHHVLCDYGAMRIVRGELRLDPRHPVGNEYIQWHNNFYFADPQSDESHS